MSSSATLPVRPPLPPGVGEVREPVVDVADGPVPLARHPDWSERFPWLVQGVTTRGPEGDPFDLALARADAGPVRERWRALARAHAMDHVVRGGQVHGAEVRLHGGGARGLLLVPGADGHATATSGVLLAVTVADCVPVFLVDGRRRAVAVLHAGWRGTAAGVLEAGLELLADRLDAPPHALHIHLGPAICGSCYEVGPEVHGALGLDRPTGPQPVDLRPVLAHRALDKGVRPERLTVSRWCTRCGDPPFYSHRGGDRPRQAAFAGIRR